MANKKYSDFAPGVPIGTSIILFADPATGALEKVALEDIAVIPGACVFSDTVLINANNNGTDPQTMGTVTVPASVLNTIGQWLEICVTGETIVTTGPPVARLILNTNDAVPISLSSAGAFRIEAWVQRVSATHIKYYQYNTRVLTNAGASNTVNLAVATGVDLTIDFRITAAAVANRVFVLGMNAKVFRL